MTGAGLHPLWRGLLDLLYPPRCEACGRLRREPFCQTCRDQVAWVRPPLCTVCGEAFDPLAQAAPACARCRRARLPFTRARAAAHYEGPLVAAVRRFKYQGQAVLARALGSIMLEALEGGAADLKPDEMDVICPVPLHELRLRERGFNQSHLLAEELGAALGKPVASLLRRTRPTLPQVELPPASRIVNVQGAFEPRLEEEIAGRRVLLVDDLFTTGATLRESARALRRGGAAEVRVFTLARPIPLWRRPARDAAAAPKQS